jgi:hypothetical protein
MAFERSFNQTQLREMLGNMPRSTFADKRKRGLIPPPDFWIGDTDFWKESTVEKVQQATPAAMAKRRRAKSQYASERYERSRQKRTIASNAAPGA